MNLAPICFFTYNRLNETKQTLEALQNNFLSTESDLFIFSDCAKNENTFESVQGVRDYINKVTGFKSVKVIERDKNYGLAKSIIEGVSEIISKYGRVIVVEDDLITAPNFLNFMNQSLDFYHDKEDVFSISGFCLQVTPPANYKNDSFFWGRAHPWGWATWLNRWNTVDWEIKDWPQLKNDKKKKSEFNAYGTDLSNMLRKAMEGRINSWYIKFTYNQFNKNKLTVYPLKSKVINIGFTNAATHCDTYNRNTVTFDRSNRTEFSLPTELIIDDSIRKQLFRYKSISYRIVGKVFTYLMKFGVIKQKIQKGKY
jgi:hypothetical protein